MMNLLQPIEHKLNSNCVTNYDKQLAADYMSYMGIDDSEAKEWAENFLIDCYHPVNIPDFEQYDPDQVKYEPNLPDKLPFATKEIKGRCIYYTYGCCTVQKVLK